MHETKNKFGWNFDNSYLQLNPFFFERVNPMKSPAPRVVLFNDQLAKDLGLKVDELKVQGAFYLSGTKLFEGSEPLAQAYAGHQFGHFNILGDGRAHLLGEHLTPTQKKFDIQLKGSGSTKFSRRGDGLAALGPMLREYIISEAMAAYNIPTTRSLAVVATGEKVVRETLLPGGVLTRVASSHIRVGTFQYAAAVEDGKHLKELADYTLNRHYPELATNEEPYLELLKAVIERQAALIVKWMQIGFIHGVMNTDNMTLSGETIDYGPCAFMDRFSLATVFSSIDRQGRYAYGQQPAIAQWNLTRLAEAMLPLLSSDEKEAISKAESALDTFGQHLQHYWLTGMREKLGIEIAHEDDMPLINTLLELMEKNQADYTNTFRSLSNNTLPTGLAETESFKEWFQTWQARRPNFNLMRSRNPAVIPRNHLVEEALTAAVQKEDYSLLESLLTILKNPYDEGSEKTRYALPPENNGDGYKTYCGT